MLALGTILPIGYDFDPRRFAEVYHQAGARTAQICRPPEKQISPDRINAIMEDLPLKVDALHAFFGNEFDISSPDGSLRRRAVRALREEVRFCQAIGGDVLVVHPEGDSSQPHETQTRTEQLLRSLDELGACGQEAAVRVAVENLPPSHSFGVDPLELLRVIQRCGNPYLALCFDASHAYAVGVPDENIRTVGPYVACIHATDTHGREDLHLLPGHGSVPWQRVLGLLGPQCQARVCLEVFEPLDEVRAALTEDWHRFIKELLSVGSAA